MKKTLFCMALISFFTFAFLAEVAASTSLTYEYDANGNMTKGDGKTFEYNDANQLVRVRHGDASGPVIAEYFYDHTGQRIKKIENGVTTYYIGKHFETKVDGNTVANTSYYFANGERVAKKDSSGQIYYYLNDHLGGTNAVADQAGNLVERTRYYPFGEIREGGNEKYTYTGKEKDKLTDSYYYEARYYNPEFMHFAQADMFKADIYEPKDHNRYSYGMNNPLKYIDPTGHFSITFSELYHKATDSLKHVGQSIEVVLGNLIVKAADRICPIIDPYIPSVKPIPTNTNVLNQNNKLNETVRAKVEAQMGKNVVKSAVNTVVEYQARDQMVTRSGIPAVVGKGYSTWTWVRDLKTSSIQAQANMDRYIDEYSDPNSTADPGKTPIYGSYYILKPAADAAITGVGLAYPGY